MWRVLWAGLLCAGALYFAPPALSQSCDHPGNAGVDQYCDPLDPPPGAHQTTTSSADRIPKGTRSELKHGSVSAQGALSLSGVKGVADPVAPPPVGPAERTFPTSGATVPATSATTQSGPTVGAGFVAVIAVLAAAIAALALWTRRRRPPSP